MLQPWTPPTFAVNKASISDLKFVFSQVEKRVKETAEEGDRIYSKSLSFFTVIIAAATGIIGYLVNNVKADTMTFFAIIVLLMLWIMCNDLRKNLSPTVYKGIGSNPRQLLDNSYFQDLADRVPEFYMLLTEIQQYEERLQLNQGLNDMRNDRLKSTLTLIYWIPVAFFGIVVITKIFFS